MQKLYIIINHYDDIFFNLGNIFSANAGQLAEAGLRWQAAKDYFWQTDSLRELASFLNFHGSSLPDAEQLEFLHNTINKELARLDQDAATAQDLLWLMPQLTGAGVKSLCYYLQSCPNLLARELCFIQILRRQDEFFHDIMRRAWKTFPVDSTIEEFLGGCYYSPYTDTREHVKQYLPVASLHVVANIPAGAPASQLNYVLNAIAGLANLPGGLGANYEPLVFPQSLPALDIFHALYFFNFSFGNKYAIDRNEAQAIACQVEQEEGLAAMLAAKRKAINGFFCKYAASNQALAAELGLNSLFSAETWLNQLTEPPEPLPALNKDAARPFVAAFPEQTRFAFLRYLRDLREMLTPEQLALASALEDYRVARQWRQDFFFPRHEPLLSVLTMTRNHSKYITDCMESVSAQAIDFPMEHIIVDDCSDDGTQDIIDNYASQHAHVRPIYLGGRSGQGENIRALFNACHSRYAALCDGDDYFIDPEKLKTQVDFLNANPDFAISFHPVLTIFENKENMPFVFPGPVNLPRGLRESYYLADLARGNFIQTNSVVYRWRFRAGLPDWFRSDICPSDWYWHLLHAETGKIHFIKIVMSVYRRHASAFYNHAFVDQRSHFQDHGMGELKTYDVLDKHFQGRYHKHFAHLANGVFSNFVQIKLDGGDGSLLDDAVAKYPEFGLNFLKNLKTVNKKYPRMPKQN